MVFTKTSNKSFSNSQYAQKYLLNVVCEVIHKDNVEQCTITFVKIIL